MYICNDCEKTFSDYKVVEEHHPYGMGFATEKWGVCPHCGSSDFSEAKECERCGELVAELEDGLCEVCYGDLYGE